MTNLVPEPNWSDVRQLEANEYATGGAGGNMNEQALSLTARTGYLDKYTASPYRTGKAYGLNERVQLESGDIVKSIITENTANPNTDMTGWVKTNDASQIFDASGRSQQQVNDTVGALWREKAGGYSINQRVMLNNGYLVKNTQSGNIVDPNIDLTGWDFVNKIVDFEAIGGVGDGDYLTGVGTDNASAFALAEIIGERGYSVRFKHNAQYKTTQQITVHNMNWIGDDNYTPIIFGWFSTSGKRIIGRNPAPEKKKVAIKGVTFWRVGPNPEHGILVDNLVDSSIDVKVYAMSAADGVVKGGAIGISPFQPEHRLSTNVDVKAGLSNSANFGVQFGHVNGGSIEIPESYNCMREVIGLEPYVQGNIDFADSNVVSSVINYNGHGLTTGYPLIYCRLTSATNMLSSPNYWFAIVIDENNFKLAATKQQAEMGQNITLTVPSGTHRIYKCGITQNITIKPSYITNNNPPTEGWSNADDGVVVITATSGGYVENITNLGVTINDKNNRAPSSCVTLLGVHCQANNFNLDGGRLYGIRINSGKLVGLRNSSGESISPPNNTLLIPDVDVHDNKINGFSQIGVYQVSGKAIIRNNTGASLKDGAVGIKQNVGVSLLSKVSNNDFGVLSGNPYDLQTSGNRNIDSSLGYFQVGGQVGKFNNAQNYFKTVTPVDGVFNIGELSNTSGGTSNYFGKVTILARHTDASSANLASYDIDIMKSNTGATPLATLIRSSGLTSGGGANHPSFTFSIVGNLLIATPVGSTSTIATFYFTVSSSFDLTIR